VCFVEFDVLGPHDALLAELRWCVVELFGDFFADATPGCAFTSSGTTVI
jgi:hypothetical protein